MPYFQASSCQSPTQLASPDVTNHYRLVTNRALLDRTKRDCVTAEEDRRYLVRIFYVANNYEAGDGIPTLKRVELGAGSFSSPVAISPGIESMQLEYGVDSNEDGAPDVFTANPNTLTDPDTGLACAAAKCAQFWRDTVAVKAYLLARTNKPLAGQVDEKEFHLGLAADGSEMVVSAANDGHRRSVYQTLARLNNPSMRRE